MVALCGGTFDPPHRAHVELPVAARDALGADWLLYAVAHASPFKTGDGAATPDHHRLEMLRLATAGLPRVSVTDLEIRRGGASYTIDTVRELNGLLPDVRLRLLVGADQAAEFHRWREARALIEETQPAVMLRTPRETRETLRKALAPHWTGAELDGWIARVVETPVVDVSATGVRETLRREGAGSASLRGVVDARVLGYIRQNGLYGRDGQRDAGHQA